MTTCIPIRITRFANQLVLYREVEHESSVFLFRSEINVPIVQEQGSTEFDFLANRIACRKPVTLGVGATAAEVRIGYLGIDRIGFYVFVRPAKAPVDRPIFAPRV